MPHPEQHNSAPFTPFPSVLVDDVMPTLKDTEWRLLCVIVRQTLGWQDKRQCGASDWLTHSQLKARTGRASAAVCSAVDVLVRRGMIEVHDEAGQPMLTPQERRRHQGRLLFRLQTRFLERLSLEAKGGEALWISGKASSKSENRIAKTTKDTQDKNLFKRSDWKDSQFPDKRATKHFSPRRRTGQWERADSIGASRSSSVPSSNGTNQA